MDMEQPAVSAEGGKNTAASLCFVVKGDPLHKIEKPYLHNYSAKGVRRTNMAYEAVDDVEIRDMRAYPLTYVKNGIEAAELVSSLSYEDFENRTKIETCFLKEARSVIRRVVGTNDVHIIEYKIRRKPPSFPYNTEESVAFEATPVLGAHCDYTKDDSIGRMGRAFGDKAPAMLSRPYQLLNLWKPLRGPVRDCPLALCDPGTVDRSTDAVRVDSVSVATVGELWNFHYNPQQKWYYLSDQRPTEALVFKGYDSREESTPGVAHCAFISNVEVSANESRESIEVRAVAFFDDIKM